MFISILVLSVLVGSLTVVGLAARAARPGVEDHRGFHAVKALPRKTERGKSRPSIPARSEWAH